MQQYIKKFDRLQPQKKKKQKDIRNKTHYLPSSLPNPPSSVEAITPNVYYTLGEYL